jgi:hypothetical protein
MEEGAAEVHSVGLEVVEAKAELMELMIVLAHLESLEEVEVELRKLGELHAPYWYPYWHVAEAGVREPLVVVQEAPKMCDCLEMAEVLQTYA